MNSLEMHFLMDCSYFWWRKRLFFNFVQKKLFQNLKNCINEKHFLDLPSTDNEIILKKFGQFMYNNFK